MRREGPDPLLERFDHMLRGPVVPDPGEHHVAGLTLHQCRDHIAISHETQRP